MNDTFEKFLDEHKQHIDTVGSLELAEQFAKVSVYSLEDIYQAVTYREYIINGHVKTKDEMKRLWNLKAFL